MKKSASDEGALDAEAARVTLVALAGMVPSFEPLDDERIRFAPDATMLTSAEAVRLLASLPKPLLCRAESVEGVLEVTCDLLAEMDHDTAGRSGEEGGSEESGGLIAELVARHGTSDELLVAACGRGRLEMVTLAGARRWLRDYEILFVNRKDSHADDVKNDIAYDRARTMGARGILQFTSPAARLSTIDGSSFAFPLAASASAEDHTKAEKSLIAAARHLLFEINEEDELAEVERDLVERGEIPADSIDGYGPRGNGYLHRVVASQMRQFFAGRELPMECAAFIDACRLR